MEIIHGNSKSARFKPHYNSALGKHYGNKADYLADMKKGGFEPYKPGAAEKVNPRKEYKPSQWAHDMANEIKKSTGKDGKLRLSSSAIDSMKKHGVVFSDTSKRDTSGRDSRQGGFK